MTMLPQMFFLQSVWWRCFPKCFFFNRHGDESSPNIFSSIVMVTNLPQTFFHQSSWWRIFPKRFFFNRHYDDASLKVFPRRYWLYHDSLEKIHSYIVTLTKIFKSRVKMQTIFVKTLNCRDVACYVSTKDRGVCILFSVR